MPINRSKGEVHYSIKCKGCACFHKNYVSDGRETVVIYCVGIPVIKVSLLRMLW